MPLIGSFGSASGRGFGILNTIIARGQQAYTTAGTYSFVVPYGVTSVSVVVVGGGGGRGPSPAYTGAGGGGLRYKNNIQVTPGQNCTVVVGDYGGVQAYGGTSSFSNGSISVTAYGGAPGSASGAAGGTGTGGDGGGNGGLSNPPVYFSPLSQWMGCGGGGAGGYSGNGGNGGSAYGGPAPTAGAGGGGGGGIGGGVWQGGGGVGIKGQGANGIAGDGNIYGGGGGSGGDTGSYTWGGAYGGGSGQNYGARGAVRIIWGPDRTYPWNAGDI